MRQDFDQRRARRPRAGRIFLHLRDFVEASASSSPSATAQPSPSRSAWPSLYEIRDATKLWARSSIFKARSATGPARSFYGYDDTLGIYFSQRLSRPGRRVGGRGRSMMPGGAPARAGVRPRRHGRSGYRRRAGRATWVRSRRGIPQDPAGPAPQRSGEGPRRAALPAVRPRIVLSFARDAAELLISGGLGGRRGAGRHARAGRRHSRQGPRRPVPASTPPGAARPTALNFLMFNALLRLEEPRRQAEVSSSRLPAPRGL